jgi:Trk K+ transport system NAD-binding subunit
MKINRRNKRLFRRIRAGWRDTLLLLREFFWPLLLFSVVVLGGSNLYFFWAGKFGEPLRNYLESVYLMLSLTFLQPTVDFPGDWHLQIFFFLIPIIGIGLLAQGVAEFASLFFNRRARGKEWEMAVASTFTKHVVLVGLGHLGYKVLDSLLNLDQEVVAIELNPNADLVNVVRNQGVPVIVDDANKQSTLEEAGVRKASTLLLCTQNDALNLQIAVKARSINNDIRVIIRIFDQHFAHAIRDQFGFLAMSSTEMSAPAFAAAAAGLQMTRPIAIEGHSFCLARLDIQKGSKLVGKCVKEIEEGFDASVVLIQNQSKSDLHPPGDTTIGMDSTIAVIAEPSVIRELQKANVT